MLAPRTGFRASELSESARRFASDRSAGVDCACRLPYVRLDPGPGASEGARLRERAHNSLGTGSRPHAGVHEAATESHRVTDDRGQEPVPLRKCVWHAFPAGSGLPAPCKQLPLRKAERSAADRFPAAPPD